VENVLTALRCLRRFDHRDFDIHVNFPGGVPVDGPSAGAAIAVAIYSAARQVPVAGDTAVTGEVSICGLIKPVGGVVAKIDAARRAGVRTVCIPRDNAQELFAAWEGVRVVPVERLDEVFAVALAVPPGLREPRKCLPTA
jgi:Lon-like ATP-dependent protease